MMLLGPYRLLRTLGGCDAGTVWTGFDAEGTSVTIAVVSAAYAADPAWLNRFEIDTNSIAYTGEVTIVNANYAPPAPWVACEMDGGPGAARLFTAYGLVVTTHPVTSDPPAQMSEPLPVIAPPVIALPEPSRPPPVSVATPPAPVSPPSVPVSSPPVPASAPRVEEVAEPVTAPPVVPEVLLPALPMSIAVPSPPVSPVPLPPPPVSPVPPPPPPVSPVPPPPSPPLPPPARPQTRAVPIPKPAAAPKRRRRGRLFVAAVALLLVAAGAVVTVLVLARPAATTSTSPPVSTSVRPGIVGPGIEPPADGNWPAEWPRFTRTDATQRVSGLDGVGVAFDTPLAWACTKVTEDTTGAHYRCGVGFGTADETGGDVIVRTCPGDLCGGTARITMRRTEDAWGLRWIRSGDLLCWADTTNFIGASRYGLVVVGYWRSLRTGRSTARW